MGELFLRDPEEYYRYIKKAGEDFEARKKANEGQELMEGK
jgi:hypothetical protein